MLLHCDVVCVTEQARLVTPFVNLALVPEAASSALLQARIGYARAFSMVAMGEAVDGKTAVEWGLARYLVTREALQPKALSVAQILAEKPIGAVRASKRLMRDGAALIQTMNRESEVFARQLQSPEAAEAFRAFAEKRPPNFAQFS
jgi:enoyl-CoA hydratase/carnithine racemase